MIVIALTKEISIQQHLKRIAQLLNIRQTIWQGEPCSLAKYQYQNSKIILAQPGHPKLVEW